MIRLLQELDRKSVLEYLYKDLNYNIFPIGDIEAFGFDDPIQSIYGEFDESGQYISIFLRYRGNGIYYSHMNHFNKEYLDIFAKEHFNYISGKSELMDLIKPYLEGFSGDRTYFCRASSLNFDHFKYDSSIKEVKTEQECERLYDLLSQIDEFGINKQTKEDFVKGKMLSANKMGITLYIEEDHKIVATVATTAETTKNAMVVAVATNQDYRNKGYATKLLVALMDLYINQKKKELCLFYNNPKAGKIYLQLGFEYIGTWDMYKKI